MFRWNRDYSTSILLYRHGSSIFDEATRGIRHIPTRLVLILLLLLLLFFLLLFLLFLLLRRKPPRFFFRRERSVVTEWVSPYFSPSSFFSATTSSHLLLTPPHHQLSLVTVLVTVLVVFVCSLFRLVDETHIKREITYSSWATGWKSPLGNALFVPHTCTRELCTHFITCSYATATRTIAYLSFSFSLSFLLLSLSFSFSTILALDLFFSAASKSSFLVFFINLFRWRAS